MTANPAEAAQSPALVRAYVAGAERRERSARHLAQRRDWVAALRLYSEAAALLLRAVLLRSQPVTGDDARALEQRSPAVLLEAVLELARRERWHPPAELERLRSVLGASEWDALDRLGDADAQRASDDFGAALRFLLGRFAELREAERRRELRWLVAGSALLGVTALAALLWSVTRPPNLALRRPVSAAPAGFQTEAAEAVNGIRFGEIGYHSVGGSPWLQVDLEAERAVRRVEVYGRGDCCFDGSIPLVVEGSRDGSTYDVLGRFSEPFQPFRPAVLRLEPRSIRYLRLRSPKRSSLMLAEVEVY